MLNSKPSSQSSSIPSKQNSESVKQKSKAKPPDLSEFEYVGRLVTRERPVIQKSKSLHKNTVFHSNTDKHHHHHHHSKKSHHQVLLDSDDDDDLSKPLGVIRINDRHFREIYRVPTPPPQVKRVFHRLRSPKPKVIERIYVRRPTPEIIENIIEVPPKQVRIINREKVLGKSKPITRTKLIRLKPDQGHTTEQQQQQTFIPSDQYSQQQAFIPTDQYSQQQQQQQQETFIPSDQYHQQQQQTFIPSNQYPQQPITFAYSTTTYLPTTDHIQSTIPSHAMFNSQQFVNPQIPQANPYAYGPQQSTFMPPYGYSQY